jgi:hypothetical protein
MEPKGSCGPITQLLPSLAVPILESTKSIGLGSNCAETMNAESRQSKKKPIENIFLDVIIS